MSSKKILIWAKSVLWVCRPCVHQPSPPTFAHSHQTLYDDSPNSKHFYLVTKWICQKFSQFCPNCCQFSCENPKLWCKLPKKKKKKMGKIFSKTFRYHPSKATHKRSPSRILLTTFDLNPGGGRKRKVSFYLGKNFALITVWAVCAFNNTKMDSTINSYFKA